MPLDPSTEAQSIFEELIDGVNFPVALVNINAADFGLPAATGPLYTAITPLSIDDLTTKVVDGNGVFDAIMTSIRAHLIEEYDQGRIAGSEYVTAYIQLVTAALSTATQFTLQRDASTYQNLLVQMQARTAQIASVIAAAELAKARQMLVLTHAQVLTAQTDYARGKMALAIDDINYTKIEAEIQVVKAQELQVEAETGIAEYKLSDIMPQEKRNLVYQTDFVLQAQVAKSNYETAQILPQQKESLLKDVAIKAYQLEYILVENYNLLKEQTEVQRAQTMDTRINGTTPVNGAIGKQKDLYDEQISSYVKDARHKSAKFWIDGWITQKSLDEGLLAPDEFSNANVNEVLASLKTALSLG